MFSAIVFCLIVWWKYAKSRYLIPIVYEFILDFEFEFTWSFKFVLWCIQHGPIHTDKITYLCHE